MARKTKAVTARKRVTEAQDASMDKRAGINEGSKRDTALDRKRGLPADTKKKRR